MCRHNHATMIRHADILTDDLFDDFYIDFLGWQCDDCGMLLNRDVTAEEKAAITPAKFDVPAFDRALNRMFSSLFGVPDAQPEVKAAKFVQMASTHRGPAR